MKATIEIRTVSPKEAIEWLSHPFPNQRLMRETKVYRLMDDMKRKRFKLGPDAILNIRDYSAPGEKPVYLNANGQHRLEAVRRTNLSQEFLVMWSDDMDLFKIVDDVMKRSVSDVVRDCKNATVLAAATNWILKYDKNMLSIRGYTNRVATRYDAIAFIEKHEALLQEAYAVVSPLYRKYHYKIKSVATGFLALATRFSNKIVAQEFVTAVFSGEGGSIHTQILHEILQKDLAMSPGKNRLAHAYILGLLIKAFNYHVSGDRKRHPLRLMDGEIYPKFVKNETATLPNEDRLAA